MSKGKEIYRAVLVCHRYALIVCLQCGIILSVCEHHAFAIAGCSAGIEDVAKLIERCLSLAFLHFRLQRKVLTKREEIFKIQRVGVVCADAHAVVVDDDALKRRT